MKWSQAAIRYRLSYISELTIRLFSKTRQGSKINGLWKTGRVYTLLEKFLPPSLANVKVSSNASLVIIYISFYILNY